MNDDGIFSIRFLMGFCVAICVLITCGMVNVSKKVERKVNEARAILKEIQQEEYPDTEKMESLLKVVMVSGVRG